jgi:hypothetical protein
MLQIYGSVLMVLSLFVMAGVPGLSLPIMIALLALAMVGFILGFIMLRMEI